MKTVTRYICIVSCALGMIGCAPASTTAPPLPSGSCTPEIKMVPDEGANHVEIGTPLSFNSNPPASGAHYPLWGRYREHTQPLHRGHYVHNLEHGAVALLYRCDAGCPEAVAALRAVMENVPVDPTCRSPIRNRIVLTADPLLDTPIAATAWTHTYRADCVDGPSLLAFITANYDHGPESLCGDGQVP